MNIRGDGAAELQCGGFAWCAMRALLLFTARVWFTASGVARDVGVPDEVAGKSWPLHSEL